MRSCCATSFLLVSAGLAAGAPWDISVPAGVKEPQSTDDIVHTTTELLAALAAGGSSAPISLHLADGTFALGGHVGAGGLGSAGELGSAGRAVTLWSSGGATLDAQGMGRVLYLDGVNVLLHKVTLANGVAPHAEGGGCLLLDRGFPWLMMRASRLKGCVVACDR